MTDRRHRVLAGGERTYLWRDIPPGLLEAAYARLEALGDQAQRPPQPLKWLLTDLLEQWLRDGMGGEGKSC